MKAGEAGRHDNGGGGEGRVRRGREKGSVLTPEWQKGVLLPARTYETVPLGFHDTATATAN